VRRPGVELVSQLLRVIRAPLTRLDCIFDANRIQIPLARTLGLYDNSLASFDDPSIAVSPNPPIPPNFDTSTPSANAIQLADPYGETSNPSGPGPADAFNTCWGNAPAPAFTTCLPP